jgi:hypothetical protein
MYFAINIPRSVISPVCALSTPTDWLVWGQGATIMSTAAAAARFAQQVRERINRKREREKTI